MKKVTTFTVLGFLILFLTAVCNSNKVMDNQEEINKTGKDVKQEKQVKMDFKNRGTADVEDRYKGKESMSEIESSKEAPKSEEERETGSIPELKKPGTINESVIKEYVRQLREDAISFIMEMDEYPPSFNALREIGEPAVPHIAELLKDNSRTIRWWAVFLLEKMGTKAEPALPYLIECMEKANDPRIQVLGVQLLGKIRNPAAIPALEKALHSPFEYVLTAALDALFQIGNEEALLLIKHTFQKPTNKVLPRALKELETKESFIPIFVMALESPSKELKLIALEFLQRMLQTYSYTEKIESAIEEAIKSIKKSEPAAIHIKKVIEEMDKHFPFRGQFDRLAADAKSGSHNAQKRLVDFLQLDWRDSHFIPLCDALAEIGKPVVPMLIEALKHSKGEALQNILVAIARMGPTAADAAPLLEKILKQGNDSEQRYALLALNRIQGKSTKSGFWFDNH